MLKIENNARSGAAMNRSVTMLFGVTSTQRPGAIIIHPSATDVT
jgi:hypothetical protein